MKNLTNYRGNFATTQQVADYYEVGLNTLQQTIKRHREEFKDNGMKLYAKKEILDFLNVHNVQLEINIPNRGMNLFPKRAILNIGMLLTGSEVAKELRSRLLDIIHDAEEVVTDNGTTITEDLIE